MFSVFAALFGYVVGIKHADSQHSAITGAEYRRRFFVGPIIEVIEQGVSDAQ